MRRQLPETPAPWTGLGIALHDAFCEWEKSEREIDVLEYFEAAYDAYITLSRESQPDLSLWQIPPNSKDVEKAINTYRTRGLERDVPNYLQRCLEAAEEGLWEIFRFDSGELALELPYEIDLDGIVVKGYIDRVQWWPGQRRAAIEDLKTGNIEKWDRRQLGTYAYAAFDIYGIEIPYGRYWFTKTDQPSEWFEMSRYTKEYLSKIYADLDNIISNKLFLPNPGDHCQLCSVKPYCRELGTLPLPSS